MTLPFLAGVVEGFYGREWSWDDRRSYARFLCETGLNSYLYCPKADSFLRKQWWRDWPSAVRRELGSLARQYRESGLNWGVGLSPYALYRDYSATARRRLNDRLGQLDDLGGNLLAVLFDDMPGDCPDLAILQAEIVADIAAWSACEHLLVCPTYYSFDPQLQQYFGSMPENYWSELGAHLPHTAQVMWTGNQVCSPTITRADIEVIAAALGRNPVLWDNYPVNDGARASRFLHLEPLPGRDPGLREVLGGHFCNPMNQAQLSRYPLAGLAQLYSGRAASAHQFFSPALCAQLGRDQALFEEQGLDGIPEAERQILAATYDRLGDPAAAEVADWLREGYKFDPECLTD